MTAIAADLTLVLPRPGRTRNLALAGLSLAGLILLTWFVVVMGPSGAGWDAYAYWSVNLADPFSLSFGQVEAFGAFRYSPPVALLMAPLALIPWPVYLMLWATVLVAALVYCTGRWALAACAFVGVPMSLYVGNIDLVIAALVVAGLRWPTAWTVAVLVKPTTGVLFLWPLVRREWHRLRWAVIVGLLIVGATMLARPDMWARWLVMLVDNQRVSGSDDLIPAFIRYPAAAALVIIGARTDRPWLLGIAAAVVQPVFGLRSMAVGVSAIGLAMRGSREG